MWIMRSYDSRATDPTTAPGFGVAGRDPMLAGGNQMMLRMMDGISVQREPVTIAETEIVAAAPVSLRSMIPFIGYYQERRKDFIKRADPGETPPDYYMNYGDLYAKRFSLELRPKLSADGQGWVDRTLRLLQVYMEDRRDANPFEFAELERDPERFKQFAYETHSSAYVNAGVCDLSVIDQWQIVNTPNLKDILTLGGVGQIGESMAMCMAVWTAPEGMSPWGRGHDEAPADDAQK